MFLDAIDQYHQQSRYDNKIPETNIVFQSEIPVTLSAKHKSFNYLIRKSDKSKLYIVSDKQRVFLTDADIINTICKMEKDDIIWFLKGFRSMYNGETDSVTMNLLDKQYVLEGIDGLEKEATLSLMSDTTIDISQFCFLITFIIAKDKCWESMRAIDGFGKKTLCKYISIIDHNMFHTEYNERFLRSLGYGKNKKAFDDLDGIKKFDISAFSW